MFKNKAYLLLVIFLIAPRVRALVTVTNLEGDDVPCMHDLPGFVQDVIDSAGAVTDREKCIALWGAVVELMPQSPGANDPFITNTRNVPVDDPIKLWNVYGFGFCSYDAHMMQACFRQIGLNTRNWEISHHTINEVWFDDGSGVSQPGWHIFDAAHERYYTQFSDGSGHIASRDDMLNEDPLNLVYCANYQDYYPGGRIPETHTPSEEYDMYNADLAGCFVGYGGRDEFKHGHFMDIPLKYGEVFTRYFQPLGDTDDYWIGQDEDASMPAYPNWYLAGFDPSPKAYSNGLYQYTPPFADARYREDIEFENNIASTADDAQPPALHLAAPGTGSLVFMFQSPYVVTSASFSATFVRANSSDSVAVYISPWAARGQTGINWGSPVWQSTGGDSVTATDVSIKSLVRGRFNYLVKLEFTTSGAPTDVGVEAFHLKTIVQNAPQALPRLKPGVNTIKAATASRGCIRCNPWLIDDDVFNRAYSYSGMSHSTQDQWQGDLYPSADDAWGEIVYKIETPGDITDFEYGGFFYMSQGNDIELDWSWDNSNWTVSFNDLYSIGYSPGTSNYVNENFFDTQSSLPAGHREIYFRYRFRRDSGVGGNCSAKDLGMNVFYSVPAASQQLQVTYGWDDGGMQTQAEVISSSDYSYNITTSGSLPETFIQPPFVTFNRYIRMELVDVDTDHDGLPDSWEIQYFGDLAQDGAGDFDTDSYTNQEEYQAGSDPTDPLDIPVPELQFSASSYSVDESDGSVTVTVMRSGRASDAVTVDYAATDITSEPGDYTLAAGVLSWTAGETGPKSFVVTINDDADSDDETVSLLLSNPTPAPDAQIIGTNPVVLTITDDDGATVETLTADRDSLVNNSSPTYNYGKFYNYSENAYAVKIESGNSYMLVGFDISGIPVSTIDSAILRLHCQSDVLGSGSLEVRELLLDWPEGVEEWAPPTQPGVTWNTTDGTTAWNGGNIDGSGNYAVTGVDSNTWTTNAGGQTLEFDVTSLVDAWINGGHSNYGMVIIGTNCEIRIFTREESGFEPELLITYSGGGPGPSPSLTVGYPNGGESFYARQQVNISWTSSNFSGSVKIEMSSDGGSSWSDIAASTENDGVYSWLTPNLASTSAACIVRVSNAAGGDPSDISDAAFTIRNTDVDGDGMDDDWETAFLGDLSHDGTGDGDGDGLTDLQEFQYGTNPSNADSDGDGASDGDEVAAGTDPNDPLDTPAAPAKKKSSSGCRLDGENSGTVNLSIAAFALLALLSLTRRYEK